MRVLFVDFNDSFSFNIVSLLESQAHHCEVINFKKIEQIDRLYKSFDLLVLGPGPGMIDDYNEFLLWLRPIVTTHPIFGVCLGHQLLGLCLGLKVTPMKFPIHGQALELTEFAKSFGIPRFRAQFYNSWHLTVVDQLCSKVNIFVEHDILVGLKAPHTLGLQFHLESVGTTCPEVILKRVINFYV